MTIILFILLLAHSVLIARLYKKVDVILTGVQQGNINRKWKGWWKIKPEDHKKIALDNRTAGELAKEYGCSRSHISQIKRNYYANIKN